MAHTYVAVLCRNQTLFRCALQSHYHLRSTVSQYSHYGWGSYALWKLMTTIHVYTACMNPTLNRSSGSVIQQFKHGNAIEIRKRIMFNSYPGAPQKWFVMRLLTNAHSWGTIIFESQVHLYLYLICARPETVPYLVWQQNQHQNHRLEWGHQTHWLKRWELQYREIIILYPCRLLQEIQSKTQLEGHCR